MCLLTGNIETGDKEGKILGCHKASEGSQCHKGHVLCLAVTSDGKFLVRRNNNNTGKQCTIRLENVLKSCDFRILG